MSNLFSGLVRGVTFRSQVTPDYTYDPSAPSAPPESGGGPAAWLMPLVKPAFYLDTPAGPVTIAPYGEPTENYASAIAVGGILTLVGVIAAIAWVARKL